MSFLPSLLKSFLRSALNQAGRDGGRVISNRVYGDQHSIPVRSASNGGAGQGDIVPPAISGDRADLIRYGYVPEMLELGVFSYIALAIGAMIIPVLGPFYWVYAGLKNLFKAKTRFYAFAQEPVFVRDRRYQTGQRQDGSVPVKRYAAEPVPAAASERAVFVAKGGLALLIAFLAFYGQFWVYQGWKG